MTGRQDSILTDSQREYLLGERDYKPSSERKKRHRIRERVRSGIADLSLLAMTLPRTEDFDSVFKDFREWNEFQQQLGERAANEGDIHGAVPPDGADEGISMTRHIHGAVGFLYIIVREFGGGVEAFEDVLATAISEIETTEERRGEANVEISIESKPRPTAVIEKFESGEQLTQEEFETLVNAGELDPIELLQREGLIVDEE